MVVWRFLENLIAVVLVFRLAPLNPCTRLTDAVRYLSPYCMACCRGPLLYDELAVATLLTSVAYVASWAGGWYLDNHVYVQAETATDIPSEHALETMMATPRVRRTRSRNTYS